MAHKIELKQVNSRQLHKTKLKQHIPIGINDSQIPFYDSAKYREISRCAGPTGEDRRRRGFFFNNLKFETN